MKIVILDEMPGKGSLNVFVQWATQSRRDSDCGHSKFKNIKIINNECRISKGLSKISQTQSVLVTFMYKHKISKDNTLSS